MEMRVPGDDFFGTGKAPPERPPISPAVREELIKSLTAAGTDEKATALSRHRSLSTLAKLTKGTDEADETAKIVEQVLSKSRDKEEKKVLAFLLRDLGHPHSNEILWAMLPEPDYSGQYLPRDFEILVELNAVGAVPQTPQDTVKVAFAIVTLHRGLQSKDDSFGYMSAAGFQGSEFTLEGLQAGSEILHRLITSGEGVQRLVEAFAVADKSGDAPDAPKPPKYYGFNSDTPVRDMLLGTLGDVKPTTDEIVTALAEALSHEDGAVRAAAALSLGKLNGEEKPAKSPEFRDIPGR